MSGVPSLFIAITDWMQAIGVKDIASAPGVWKGKTTEAAGIGPFDVKFNAHAYESDGVPPYGAVVGDDRYFPGIAALVGVNGGAMIGGMSEAEMTAHFKAQPRTNS